jgi:succinate dehydrogenase / fumarate reductase flavoprotein subunit
MERLPGIRQIAMDFAGVDPVEEPIPVQPGQHYSMGGIDVDTSGLSGLPGLYAAGECACISVHGANRLGGNSLLETVVFGRLVADSIVRENPKVPAPAMGLVESAVAETEGRIREILGRNGGNSPFGLLRELEETMFSHFGIFREGRQMQVGLEKIKRLKERCHHVSLANRERAVNQALIRYLELEGMLELAGVVALGAIAREESRGSHTRRDHPRRDDARFLAHTVAKTEEGAVIIRYKPVTLGMFKVEERGY